jgi:hypothetical protein
LKVAMLPAEALGAGVVMVQEERFGRNKDLRSCRLKQHKRRRYKFIVSTQIGERIYIYVL